MKNPIALLILVAVTAVATATGFSGARWMSRPDGSLQCEAFDIENATASLKAELSKAGVDSAQIEHVPAAKASGMRMALCGSPTGGSFKIRVGSSQSDAAARLGFTRL